MFVGDVGNKVTGASTSDHRMWDFVRRAGSGSHTFTAVDLKFGLSLIKLSGQSFNTGLE